MKRRKLLKEVTEAEAEVAVEAVLVSLSMLGIRVR